VKPGQRPLKANARRSADETPEEFRARIIEAVSAAPQDFFLRAEVVRLDSEVNEAMADIWAMSQQMQQQDKTHRWPRNPDHCFKWGQTCTFFGVCCGEESLENNERLRLDARTHPELEGAARETLTASRLAAARGCARLEHYRYGLGWRAAVDSEALRFGTLIHVALEAWWKADEGRRLEAALMAVRGQE
jgi:hypothetical protein